MSTSIPGVRADGSEMGITWVYIPQVQYIERHARGVRYGTTLIEIHCVWGVLDSSRLNQYLF